ncbi:DUF350 domain-containing protein [Haliovirga abyssi]|uniref:DUF350 domain-containing protein n=1 Tax=Haliovirga abyssi TaxID=2996794 RepID=A0AAU9D8Z8_9FUSO|nr:hypothetical protein [Haliovirga abyssi]BDU49750.1 hypothetical protein HLVA_03190 [Haliovirga abyssi]
MLYVSIYILVGLIFAFFISTIVYDKALTKGFSLKEYLFEKDSKAVWVDYFGGFILPAFLITYNSVTGGEAKSLILDLLTILIILSVAIAVLAVVRVLNDKIILNISSKYGDKTTLNNEIFNQSNLSASFFNIAFTSVITNILLQESIFEEKISVMLLRALLIFLFNIIVFIAYKFLEVKREVKIYENLFEKDNSASGLTFLGYIVSWQIILYKLVNFYDLKELYSMVVSFMLILVFYEIIKLIIKFGIKYILKEDIEDEIYLQKNIGAGFGMFVIYTGIALLISGVLFG